MRGKLFVLGALVAATAAFGVPVLETDTMRVEFGPDAEGFGLRRIVNKMAGGAAFVAPRAGETDLWELRIVGKGAAGTNETLRISNRASCERSFSCADGRVSLAWRGIDLPGEKKTLDVFVEVKGQGGKWKVRDCWRQKDEGVFEGKYAMSVPGHATHLIRLVPDAGAGHLPCLVDVRDNSWRRAFEADRKGLRRSAPGRNCGGCE